MYEYTDKKNGDEKIIWVFFKKKSLGTKKIGIFGLVTKSFVWIDWGTFYDVEAMQIYARCTNTETKSNGKKSIFVFIKKKKFQD